MSRSRMIRSEDFGFHPGLLCGFASDANQTLLKIHIVPFKVYNFALSQASIHCR